MSTNTEEKMIKMRTLDGKEFVVEEEVAMMSGQIRHMIEDNCANDIIPLPNVTSKILTKAMAYCKMHLYKREGVDLDTGSNGSDIILSKNDLENWEKEFLNVDQDTLFDLILAANFLDIDGLMKLTLKSVADQMIGKSAEEIRTHFHIINDYTPEEEEEIRQELSWAFE